MVWGVAPLVLVEVKFGRVCFPELNGVDRQL